MKVIWQARWQKLAPRERQVISWGGAVLLAGVMYAYLWQPLSADRAKLRATLPQLRSNAAAIAAQSEEVRQLRNNPRVSLSGPALLAAIQRDIDEARVGGNSAQISLLDESRSSITFQKVSFESWTELTSHLQNNQYIRLESCTVAALAEPGVVRVQAIMAAGTKQAR